MRRLGARLILLPFLVCFVLSSVYSQESPRKVDEKNSAAIVEYLESVFRYENDGTGSLISQVRVQIKTQQGLQAFGQVYFPFRDEMQSVEINYVRTVKASGEVINVPESSVMEITAPVAQMAPVFSDLKFKVVPVPNLQVGDWVEYKSTLRIHEPFTPGDFWATHYPTRSLPVHSEVAVLDIPVDRKIILTFDETAEYTKVEEDGRVRHTWKTSNPEAVKPSEDPAPLFSMSTIQHWEQVGDWYLKLQAPQKVITSAIRAKAGELTRGLSSPAEKLNALYQYVAQSVRYVGLSFGLGGYQPHAASEVLRNSYGDCKDKHTLLSALLAAVDIPSYPVLLHSQRDTDPEVPSPGQFDHLITAVPLGDSWAWMDTTLEVAPLGFLPETFRGKQALVIRPAGSALIEIPKESPVPEKESYKLQGSIDSRGRLSGVLEASTRGTAELPLRIFFRHRGKGLVGQQQAALARLLVPAKFGEADFSNLQFTDPLDVDDPFAFSFDMEIKRFVIPLGKSDRVMFPVFAMQVVHSWRAEGREEAQKFPNNKDSSSQANTNIDGELSSSETFHLGLKRQVEENMMIEIDPSFEVTPPGSVTLEHDFASFESSTEMHGNSLRVRRSLTILQEEIPRQRLPELREFSDSILSELAKPFIFKRTRKPDALDIAGDLTDQELSAMAFQALNRGDSRVARELFELASERLPGDKTIWLGLGLTSVRGAKYQRAVEAFQRTIEIDSKYEKAYRGLSEVYLLQGMNQEAVQTLESLLEINPYAPKVYGVIGQAHLALYDWPKAEAAFNHALLQDGEEWGFYASLGIALHLQNKIEEAQLVFDRAIQLGPLAEPASWIAQTLLDFGSDMGTARRYAESAVKVALRGFQNLPSARPFPVNSSQNISMVRYLDTLGWIEFKRGNLSAAEKVLRVSFDLLPTSLNAEHLTILTASRERFPEALDYYAWAVHVSGERSVAIPVELVAFAETQTGKSGKLSSWLKARYEKLKNAQIVLPKGVRLTMPTKKRPQTAQLVIVACLIDAVGTVTKAEVFIGQDPWKSAARTAAKKIVFPPFEFGGKSYPHLRYFTFLYKPDGAVTVRKALVSIGAAYSRNLHNLSLP